MTCNWPGTSYMYMYLISPAHYQRKVLGVYWIWDHHTASALSIWKTVFTSWASAVLNFDGRYNTALISLAGEWGSWWLVQLVECLWYWSTRSLFHARTNIFLDQFLYTPDQNWQFPQMLLAELTLKSNYDMTSNCLLTFTPGYEWHAHQKKLAVWVKYWKLLHSGFVVLLNIAFL